MATAAPPVSSSQTQPLASQRTLGERGYHPLVLWHLLSLDAPTVAVTWTGFVAKANHVYLPLSSQTAMFLAVWTLYAADRLLDARILQAHPSQVSPLPSCQLAPGLELRHLFHHRHRAVFLSGIVAALIALAVLMPHLAAEALRLYVIEGCFLLGYFLLIHATAIAHRFPKELAVGIFFAAAVFIPTIARAPVLRLRLALPAMLLVALCILNCLFICAWEQSPRTPHSTLAEPHPATRVALRHLKLLAILNIVVSLGAAAVFSAIWPIPVAIALATALLLTLHIGRHHLQPTSLRAAADLALLPPLLLLHFVH